MAPVYHRRNQINSLHPKYLLKCNFWCHTYIGVQLQNVTDSADESEEDTGSPIMPFYFDVNVKSEIIAQFETSNLQN